ncbi:type II toxin-antitoxin system PrlF family antitoxin [Lactobacillus sp. ESL0684]|uniref:type II toxin-antitoxin system PrlF family antitoxin n=1 Tax=Lactobacillus sp. ESL0684 TaxID=2983213 RepID=UPI0023FA481D|nr:type II toxin-antitoxin system PrlF family antitoxin [Lactobacillus sp. ESL0684]WEV43858.1 type II toxin-antitoxin system PrlF family antitoxin [Lactobacillus sp. ESL0684]
MQNLTKISSKITSKNQITIPKTVRNILQVNPQDKIEWLISPDGKITVTTDKPNLWDIIDEQEKQYGSIATSEVEWGKDIESEDFG